MDKKHVAEPNLSNEKQTKHQTIIFKLNGTVVNAKENMDAIMSGEIIGETELRNGRRTLAFRGKDYEVNLLSFDKIGQAHIDKRYENLEPSLIDKLKDKF